VLSNFENVDSILQYYLKKYDSSKRT